MNTYNLCVEELVKVWRSTDIQVTANSEKEAVQRYLDGHYDINYSEYLCETEECVNPEKGPSIEIFNDTKELIYSDNERDK